MIRVQVMIVGHGKVIWCHMSSQPVFFSPITRDRMEIESRKLCQETWLVKPLREICILTYFGQDLTLAWPDVRFWSWPFKVKCACALPARRGEHDGVILIFISLIPRTLSMKNHLREKNIWWLLEPKFLTLGKIWSKKASQGYGKKSYPMLFWILLSYHALGDNSDFLRKVIIF